MIDFFRNRKLQRGGPRARALAAGSHSYLAALQLLLLAVIPILYVATLARSLVLGDPTEYTLVAHVLGIAHPPGYAFITLAGKAFQSLIPLGSIPWRMHLLSAFSASLAALLAYGTVREVWREPATEDRLGALSVTAALFSALTIATATDVWQHAIHANPHIITATFLMANLYFLTRWWAASKRLSTGDPGEAGTRKANRWLYAFSFSAGLGVTHHPLTVFSFPAYAVFILVMRPGILRQGRTVLKTAAFALLGLSLWLYFPVRSAMQPVFGPHDMNTLDGFLDHVLARGLTESLPFFGLPDQPMRALVFWSLLRLQYTLPVLVLALVGAIWLLRRGERRSLGLLYGLAFLSNYVFVINLRAQDIMAYLLGPFMLVGLLSGVGLLALLRWAQNRLRRPGTASAAIAAGLFLLGPAWQAAGNLPRISLQQYDEGRRHVEAVFDTFEGRGEGAVLLHDWETMTPMWYARFVEGRWPDPQDVRPEFVSTQRPWVQSVFDYLPGGAVYVNTYRREIVDAGFRLRPRGPFYQVVEPGNETIPPEVTPLSVAAGEIEVVGFHLPQRDAQAGDYVTLTLAMRAPQGAEHVYVPSLQLGSGPKALDFTFTTDNHLLTTTWEAGEAIVEDFSFALPHDMAAGDYELVLRIKDLSDDRFASPSVPLETLHVRAQVSPPETEQLLANFRQRVGLARALAWKGIDGRRAPWPRPLTARAGETINLVLQWQSLARAEESYTVFVHLIDAANRPRMTLDYTPLGGAAPTHLWIPKWLPGQRYLDPYRLTIGDDIPPGNYFVEVGLYEMRSGRRLHISDQQGNLAGDRYVLGPVTVVE